MLFDLLTFSPLLWLLLVAAGIVVLFVRNERQVNRDRRQASERLARTHRRRPLSADQVEERLYPGAHYRRRACR